MPSNDIEAFEYVVSDKETALEIDYLTYAMFAYKKQKWIEHFSGQTMGKLRANRKSMDGSPN